MDMIEFFISFFITYFLIRITFAIFKIYKTSKQEAQQELFEKVSKFVHVVEEEKHGDQYYWFDKDTQEFLTQGVNADAIIENLKKYYTNHVFIINETFILSGPDWQFTKNLDSKIRITI